MKYYIAPTIRQTESGKLIDFLDKKQSSSDYRYHLNHVSFDELSKKNKVFILGEPGFGKSTLLIEMARSFCNKNTPFAFLDLKRKAGPLAPFLMKHTQVDTSEDQLFDTIKGIWSIGFDLNEPGVLLLDALDEVSMDLIPDLLIELANFTKDYPEKKIYISSRTHHLTRHDPFLRPLDFEAVELDAFSMQQMVRYLQKNCSIFEERSEKEIVSSLQSVSLLKYYTSNNLLYTPRYLEIFSQLVETTGIDEIASYTRHKLLDTIIAQRLRGESGKASGDRQNYNSKIGYVQQCLERLALVMEIQRTNLISKEDFTTFLLDTNLNLDNQLLLEVFFDNTVLKDTGDNLTFDNTEFQEYLAAKALQRIGRIDQTIADVGIDQHLQTVLPNWLDVLGYVTELEPGCLLPLLQLGKRSRNINVFSLIRYTDLDYFAGNPVLKDQIFQLVFGYFIDECRWLDQELATALPTFYIAEYHDPIFQEIVQSEMNFKGYVRKTSLIFILEKILSLDLSESDKAYWKPILFKYLSFDNFEFGDVLHRYSAKCLEKIASIEDFTPYLPLFEDRPPSVGQAIMEFHRQVDPNHVQSIKIFVAQQLGSRVLTISPLTNISSREGFLHLFEILTDQLTKIKAWNLLFDSLDTDLRYPLHQGDHFFSRLAKLWDQDIELWVVRFLMTIATDWYYAYHSSFVAEVIKLVKKESASPVSLILDQIVEHGFPHSKYFELGEVINKVLDLSHYADFHHETQSKLADLSLAEEVLRSSREDISEKLYQQYFPEKFEARKIKRAASDKRDEVAKHQLWEWETKTCEQFNAFLEQHDLRAIQLYRDQKETISKFLTESDIERLHSVATNYLEEFSPKDCLPTRKDGNIFYPSSLVAFQIIISQVQDIHLDVSPFRDKILKILPISYHQESILAALVEEPTYEEIKSAVNWFLNEINYQFDYDLYPSLKLIQDYDIKHTEPWLLTILQNPNASLSDRLIAFSKLASRGIGEEKVLKIFNDIDASPNEDSSRLAKEINVYLIQKENDEAVTWRMEQVLKQPYQEYTVKRTTSIIRLAPDGEGLSRPLAQLSHPKHIEKMHWFLKQSFLLVNEDPNYYNYVKAEFWEVVAKYFKNLKTQKSQLKTYLEQLRKLVHDYGENNLVSWFNYYFTSIQNEYLEYLSEPQHFGDSIRKFNQLKEKQYLDISYPVELFQLVREVLDNDLRKWLSEGYYGFMADLEKPKGSKLEKEKIYQKDLIIKLENFLLRRGLRPSDITLHREPQMLDDRRTDLIITYGSIGSVLIEVKRADNTDLTPKQIPIYREDTFLPYLRQNDCDFGVFLIYNDNPNRKNFTTQIRRVLDCYREEDRIAVVGINISKSSKSLR